MIDEKKVTRFSDEELVKFHEQFQQHIQRYDERVKTEDARHQNVLAEQRNTNDKLDSLIKNTGDIVELYTDVKGTIRIGVIIQKFLLWVAKWGVIGGVITAFWEFVIKKIH